MPIFLGLTSRRSPTLRAAAGHHLQDALTALNDDFDERFRTFSKLIDNQKLTEADITRLVPEWIADLERDIIREALWLRRHIDAGTTPAVRGDVGALAAIVAIPPEVAVPDVIFERVRADREYVATTPWEQPEPLDRLQGWLRAAFYLAALGPDDGDDLRARFHTGHFADLTADDRRTVDNFDDNAPWPDRKPITDALISAVTGEPTTTVTQPPRPIDNPMQYVV